MDRTERRTTKLVLKTVGTAEEPIAEAEFARHRRALREAPASFAEAHLAALWGDPIRVGDGMWITLQVVAGDGADEIEPMAVLLDHALGRTAEGTPPRRAIDIDPDVFARTCGEVVGAILREWSGSPHAPDAVGVADFLGAHLGDHLTDPERLLPYVRRYPDRNIVLDGADPLPNPLALARGTYFAREPLVHVLSVRSHGDLHSDNVLVVARPRVDSGQFFLIDLAGYERQGPSTRDPTHFVLHLIARNLDDVSTRHRDRLIDLLLDPDDPLAPNLLPAWLVKAVTAVHSACHRWAAGGRMETERRTQALLSLVGCALRIMGRKSTREEDKPWFLRLAARAAAKYVTNVDPDELSPPPGTASRPVAPSEAFDDLTARSAALRRTLHVPKVHREVRRKLVDEDVVPALLGGGPLRVITIRGDAGAGKSTIAGQVYDALAEHGDVITLVVPCQNIDAIPESVHGFDEAVGALIGTDGPATGLVRRLTASGRRSVVLLDTVDNLLEQQTGPIVVDWLAQLVEEGASVVLTTRPFHFDAWIKPYEARLAGALRPPTSVPHLDREEVLALVFGYVTAHPSDNVPDPAGFAGRVWELSAERSAMQLIVRNPYFLFMLCETFVPAGTVPPDLTTSRLCDRYVKFRVYGSRRYPTGHDVLKGKRRLWQLVAGELWKRSKDRIALVLPQSWLDDNADDQEALRDLLSEEVLVRSPADPTSVQFNHQFLAEFSMAIHLRDHGVDVLYPLLDAMRGAPGSKWFAWPVVRHVLARAYSTEDLDATLARMDLAENYAYQVAAQGLVEQSFPGYLAKLAEHERNYASLFTLQVLHFVDDAKVGEALTLLTSVLVRGD
ncbi:NACHT domain-containing protein, partial [Actinosynnema sp. NPDC023658]|uniref:NACHT domain-containing protein n=1 Tax=Actinosynnema sp. NPDC023658 TaxID=3155465 RepID=UPI0033C4085C